MGPIAMFALLVGAVVVFAWSASRRAELLFVGRFTNRFDHVVQRLRGTWRYAFRQEKMDYYSPAGVAHKLIFTGFVLLLFRTIVLVGRGFSPSFNLFVLDPSKPLGMVYEFAKDVIATLVIVGALVFVYYRAIKREKRMSLSGEGLLILGIIMTMMVADIVYDGAAHVLLARHAEFCQPLIPGGDPRPLLDGVSQATCDAVTSIVSPLADVELPSEPGWHAWPSPAGSAVALLLDRAEPGTLAFIAQAGFWTHVTLVLLFLNLLPHSKHFHVITAIPNVFHRDLSPAGRLKPMAESSEKLMEQVGAAAELADPMGAPVGVARIHHFTWKALLDFYTCTECGRCSDNCPAHTTGKILSPKHLTLALRDHLYGREQELIDARGAHHLATPYEGRGPGAGVQADLGHPDAKDPEAPSPTPEYAAAAAPDPSGKPINLAPDVIHPDVLWACTSCRACEEQCPVLISYVDKIVDMRRNLVMVRGEFPHELQKPFTGMEVNGNPWNLSRLDRAGWSDGLGLAFFADKREAEVLYWVGCAASYDDRAKKIARATARLLQAAGVDFAILGQEESCTGDPARRAGNEYLFVTLAEANVATLNGYKDKGGMKKVVTTCPHCFNTLKNEYPDFGAKLEVVHHTDFLLGLLAEKRLDPKHAVNGRVVYHDSCYLGRYNGVYEPPREILRRIPGVTLVEPEYWTKQRGLCCGAGGAQMFMEEQNNDRVNVRRTLQLLDTKAETIASACPFCMTMLTDGLKSKSVEDRVAQMDVAELLERSCLGEDAKAPVAPPPSAGDESASAPVAAE